MVYLSDRREDGRKSSSSDNNKNDKNDDKSQFNAKNSDENEENNNDLSKPRMSILSLLDDFIEQIQHIRSVMLGVSISGIVLAPLAIALSAYLLLHPRFFIILEIEDEFGVVLSVLLGAVLTSSIVWLVTGIRQYYSISLWKRCYTEYQKEKEEIDRKIASKFGLDQD